MNKKFLLLAAAAMTFAACSDNFESLQEQPPVEQQLGDGAIAFGAYVNRTTTRAGQTGTLLKGDYDTDIQTGLGRAGFGVFAYYTGSELYAADSYKPDFMYNQRVYNTSKTPGTYTWNYEPVKYWPNEFGAGAVSDEIDRLTFFAYAPYVSVNPSTGNVTNKSTTTPVTSAADDQYYTEDNGDATTGIIGMSRNSASSDPYVKYAVSLAPTQCVDLCYGVAGTAFHREGLADVAVDGNLVDLTKPATSDKISFNFKHALAALNVQIDAAVDALDPGTAIGTNANGDVENGGNTKTRIYVRSIQFEGLTDRGMLNLRDHAWYDMTTGQAGLSGTLTLNDGRSDGREAVMVATNESNVALNPDIVQVGVSTNPGVTATAVNLFDDAVATNAIYVIPTGQELRVTIVYDVETQDDNLSGYLSGSNTHGISVENAITQTVSSGFTLAAGQAYTLKLHLGMNSVKFDVNEIAEWPVAATEAETSLPANVSGSLADVKTAINGADASEFAALQTLYVGKFVNADGSIASAKTASTVGVIAQLSQSNVDDGVDGSRILVMAAEDVPQNGGTATSFPWKSTNALLTGTATDVYLIDATNWAKFSDETPNEASSATNNTCRSGRLNGYAICSDAANNVAENYAIYTAFNYDLTAIDGINAAGYGTDATSGAAGHWFLPTVEQMINMGASEYRYDGTNAINGSYPKSGVMANLSGGYWSSSEYNATYAWYYHATNGYWNGNYKAANYIKVRPVFAY